MRNWYDHAYIFLGRGPKILSDYKGLGPSTRSWSSHSHQNIDNHCFNPVGSCMSLSSHRGHEQLVKNLQISSLSLIIRNSSWSGLGCLLWTRYDLALVSPFPCVLHTSRPPLLFVSTDSLEIARLERGWSLCISKWLNFCGHLINRMSCPQ